MNNGTIDLGEVSIIGEPGSKGTMYFDVNVLS